MRKVLVSIAALGAALAATPGMAQSWGNPGGGYGQPGYGQPGYGNGQPGYGYGNDYGRPGGISPFQVRDAVERAIQRGELSRGEARELRDDVRDLFRLDARARRDGYGWGERREIDRRARETLRDLRRSQQDRDGRDYGGRGDWRDRPDYRNGY